MGKLSACITFLLQNFTGILIGGGRVTKTFEGLTPIITGISLEGSTSQDVSRTKDSGKEILPSS